VVFYEEVMNERFVAVSMVTGWEGKGRYGSFR